MSPGIPSSGAERDSVPTAEFQPRIIGFLCNWCSYAGADRCGASQLVHPPNLHAVRVMCTGRVDPEHVLQALASGADGVLILGCHPGDCHYKEQNYRALQRHGLLLRLLAQAGVEPRRCRFEFVSAAEGEKYARVVAEHTQLLRELGPR